MSANARQYPPASDQSQFSRVDLSPPRLSDRHGAERLDALYKRAAADRDRFRERQLLAMQPTFFERLIARLRR